MTLRLGVALTWHTLAFENLLAAVQRAEELGYAAVYVDGDVTQLGVRREAPVLDGWTVTTALLARTQRIGIGSIRLVQHWNPAHLAQAVATAETIAPGRLQFLISIGDRPDDPAWGIPALPASERIAWLDECLDAMRALWRGESVTRDGPHVVLKDARVRPRLAVPIPIEIGARGPRLLRVVARHADIWNVNWPAVPGRVAASGEVLAAACREVGRDPASIRRRMWMFTRVETLTQEAALAEFRRWNPWYADVPDEEVAPGLVVGSPDTCRDQLARLSAELGLEMPVLDLSGLDAAGVHAALETFPGGEIR